MSNKKYDFPPNLHEYPTLQAFRVSFPKLKFSDASFYRERDMQRKAIALKHKKEQEDARSIVTKHINEVRMKAAEEEVGRVKGLVELAATQNIPIKNLFPLDFAMKVTNRAVESISLHMITQWQAAAWWLERVHPEVFGKKEAPTGAATLIGIRLEVHHKQGALSKKNDVTRLSVPVVKQIKLEEGGIK